MADAPRHDRVKQLFLACCDLPPEEAEALLRATGHEDQEVADEVRAMLDFDGRRPEFLEEGPGALPLPTGSVPDQERPLPDTIGPYRILGRLGEGGMGTVYEAEQTSPYRTIALKLLHPGINSKRTQQRFELEGQILARLEHPGIARIYATGQFETGLGSQSYLAMERIHGVPLKQWAREAGATTTAVVDMIARACEAVEHAHRQGVIHRDLKSANLLVDAEGRPHVLDFGVARLVDSDLDMTRQTRSGEIVGTMAYMSPEQASGDPGAIDARSDIYSLGVLLYELLMGKLPYDVSNSDMHQAVMTIQTTEVQRHELRRALPADLATIVLKALEKEKSHRYETAAALAADLRHYLDHEPIEARQASRVYYLRKFVRRHRVIAGAVVAVVLTLSLGLAAALHFRFGEARQRALAMTRAAEANSQAYRSGLLATQLSRDKGNHRAALALLDETPEELRGWEYGAMRRLLERKVAEITLPEALLAEYLDEGRILIIGEQGGGWIWNAVSGALTPVPVPTGMRPLALSRDGSRLLSGVDGRLEIRDPLRGEVLFELPFPHDLRPSWRTSALSEDGRYVVVTTKDSRVFLFDTTQAEADNLAREALAPASKNVFSVAFSRDGTVLALGKSSGVSLHACSTGERVWSYKGPGGKYWSVLIDDARGTLLSSVAANFVHVDMRTGLGKDVWRGSDLGTTAIGVAFDLDLHPEGTQLAAVFQKDSNFLFDRVDGGRIGWLPAPGSNGTGKRVRYSPSGRTLLLYSRKARTLGLWSTEKETTRRLSGHGNCVEGLQMASDGKTAVTASWDRTARLWDLSSGQQTAEYRLRNRAFCVALSPDGKTLVCGLDKVGTDVIDTRTGERRLELKTRARSLAFSPDGSELAVGQPTTSSLALVDPETLEIRWQEKVGTGPVVSVAWSSDGTRLAAGTGKGNLALWSYPALTRLAELQGSGAGARDQEGARSISFSPDGEQLVVGWGSSEVTLYDTEGLSRPRSLSAHHEEVFSVAFSPDGQRIATGGRDGILRLWDPESGGLLAGFENGGGYIRCLVFTPDGRQIVTACADRELRSWDSSPRSETWHDPAPSPNAE